MNKIISIFLLVGLWQYGFACDKDSSVVKRHKLKEQISFKTTVKLSYNDEYSIFMDGERYLNEMSKTFSFLKKFKNFKDTLFIHIRSTGDTSIIYSLSVKDSDNGTTEYYSEESKVKAKSDFSIHAFCYNSSNYVVYNLLKNKRALVYNEIARQMETKIIVEKFSEDCGIAGRGGFRWEIEGTNIVIANVVTWIGHGVPGIRGRAADRK